MRIGLCLLLVVIGKTVSSHSDDSRQPPVANVIALSSRLRNSISILTWLLEDISAAATSISQRVALTFPLVNVESRNKQLLWLSFYFSFAKRVSRLDEIPWHLRRFTFTTRTAWTWSTGTQRCLLLSFLFFFHAIRRSITRHEQTRNKERRVSCKPWWHLAFGSSH